VLSDGSDDGPNRDRQGSGRNAEKDNPDAAAGPQFVSGLFADCLFDVIENAVARHDALALDVKNPLHCSAELPTW